VKYYNVEFVMDYMVVMTSIGIEDDTEVNDIILTHRANDLIKNEYGFSPIDMCFDFVIHELG
jgi:hypothetical protein